MAADYTPGHCRSCKKRTRHYKNRPNHLVHWLAILFLCGLWFPIYLVVVLWNEWDTPWICMECGSSN